jgi:membrane protein YqaA with SNARE-associated domain
LFKEFITTLQSYGPLGVLLLTFIDSAGIPVTVALDGFLIYLCVVSPENALWATICAVVGSAAGNVVLYWIARKGGEKYLAKQDEGRGVSKFSHWFHRYGLLTVFVPALVPIPMPMKAFVILSGVFSISLGPFLATVLVARVLRYGTEAWLGVAMGNNAALFIKEHVWHLAGFAVGLFAVLYLIARVIDRKHALAREVSS